MFPFSFLFVIEHMMPLCMVISWVYSVAMTIQHIVAEKEHRLKEVGLGVCRHPPPSGRPWGGQHGPFFSGPCPRGTWSAAPPHR